MKPSRNLWPLAIILTLAVFVSGIIGMAVLASTQRVDLVSADYYDQELKYQSHIDSQERAKDLGTNASITYDAALQRILIRLPEEQTQAGVSGQVRLYRPSMSGLDQQIPLDMKDGNLQSLDASHLQSGLWRVRVAWTAKQTDFSLEQKIVVGLKAKVAATTSH